MYAAITLAGGNARMAGFKERLYVCGCADVGARGATCLSLHPVAFSSPRAATCLSLHPAAFFFAREKDLRERAPAIFEEIRVTQPVEYVRRACLECSPLSSVGVDMRRLAADTPPLPLVFLSPPTVHSCCARIPWTKALCSSRSLEITRKHNHGAFSHPTHLLVLWLHAVHSCVLGLAGKLQPRSLHSPLASLPRYPHPPRA